MSITMLVGLILTAFAFGMGATCLADEVRELRRRKAIRRELKRFGVRER